MRSRLDLVSNWDAVFAENGFSLRRTCMHCRVTPRHLERYFLIKFGYRPRDVLQEARMKAAILFLSRGKLVKETAFLLGYRSPSHFVLVFRRHYGRTPLSWLLTRRGLSASEMWSESKQLIACASSEGPMP
jgi:AraC-like DNA-binding protein